MLYQIQRYNSPKENPNLNIKKIKSVKTLTPIFKFYRKRTIRDENMISTLSYYYYATQKMKISIMDFFSKCDQIRSFLRIWSHLLKKSLMENFIFCSMLTSSLNKDT